MQNSKQFQNSNASILQTYLGDKLRLYAIQRYRFEFLSFYIRICFEFRDSNFKFIILKKR